MNFELLPNEIILDIFDYIDSINLLNIFYGLNARFTYLLYKQYRGYCFNFLHHSKENFDTICQQHLPSILNQVFYLSLGNFTETPGQINFFISSIPSINSLTYLRILKFSNLSSEFILIKIIYQLPDLKNLTHLYFDSCYCQNKLLAIQTIMNKFWNIRNLKYLYFDIDFGNQMEFVLPTNISTSIQCLKLNKCPLTYNQLKQLFQYTPSIKQLKLSLDFNTIEHCQLSHFLTLTHLQISSFSRFDPRKMTSFLQNLSNLRQLYVHLSSNIINGYEWEQLIENYLPKLKSLRFIMAEAYLIGENIHEQVDQLLHSFQSSFWIDQHQWFVRSFCWHYTIHLETLPSASHHFKGNIPYSWKSTDPTDDIEKDLQTISSIYSSLPLVQSISTSGDLASIDHISLRVFSYDEFRSIHSNLDQLKSLTITSYQDSFQSQFVTLLDCATNLLDLTIGESRSFSLQRSLLKCQNKSIRKLNLEDYNHQWNEKECFRLSQSSLGMQCETLSIQVENCRSIVILIENMVNLKALHVQYGEKFSASDLSTYANAEKRTINMKETIQWLKKNLPSTCFISKDFTSDNSFQIWIK